MVTTCLVIFSRLRVTCSGASYKHGGVNGRSPLRPGQKCVVW